MKAFYEWIYFYYNNKWISTCPRGLCLDNEVPENKEVRGLTVCPMGGK